MAVASNYGVGAGKTATGKTNVIGKVTPVKPIPKAIPKPVPKPVPKTGNTFINTEDVAARQKAIQALRADDAAYFDMLNKVPDEAPITAPEAAPWTLEGDALYQQALAAGNQLSHLHRLKHLLTSRTRKQLQTSNVNL